MVKPRNIKRLLWQAAKREAHAAMIAAARGTKGTMTYNELAAGITAMRLEPDLLVLRELANDISFEENTAGRGMLGAVVVHQGADGLPGQGFFTLAKGLGRETNDQVKFWASELARVREIWKRQKPE